MITIHNVVLVENQVYKFLIKKNYEFVNNQYFEPVNNELFYFKIKNKMKFNNSNERSYYHNILRILKQGRWFQNDIIFDKRIKKYYKDEFLCNLQKDINDL